MKLKKIHENAHTRDYLDTVDWIHPDILYNVAKKNDDGIITFLYDNNVGLLTAPGYTSHGRILYNSQHDDKIYELYNDYINNSGKFRKQVVNGRVASIKSLMDFGESIRYDGQYIDINKTIKSIDVGNDGYIVSVWDNNSSLLDCINELYDNDHIQDPVYICTPSGMKSLSNGSTRGMVVDPTDVDKIRRMHLMRGDNKKELMDKLGLDPKSKEHDIAAAMKERGLLKPGQKWWALTSEGID